MTTTTELTPLLKRLKLGAVLNTLPERVALARREQLDYASFLQIILTDEINRRDHRRLELRLQRAGFEQTCRLEGFDWSASITLDRRLLDAAFSPSSWTATSTGSHGQSIWMQLRLNRWQQPAELQTSHLWWIEKQVCRLPYGFKLFGWAYFDDRQNRLRDVAGPPVNPPWPLVRAF